MLNINNSVDNKFKIQQNAGHHGIELCEDVMYVNNLLLTPMLSLQNAQCYYNVSKSLLTARGCFRNPVGQKTAPGAV